DLPPGPPRLLLTAVTQVPFDHPEVEAAVVADPVQAPVNQNEPAHVVRVDQAAVLLTGARRGQRQARDVPRQVHALGLTVAGEVPVGRQQPLPRPAPAVAEFLSANCNAWQNEVRDYCAHQLLEAPGSVTTVSIPAVTLGPAPSPSVTLSCSPFKGHRR